MIPNRSPTRAPVTNASKCDTQTFTHRIGSGKMRGQKSEIIRWDNAKEIRIRPKHHRRSQSFEDRFDFRADPSGKQGIPAGSRGVRARIRDASVWASIRRERSHTRLFVKRSAHEQLPPTLTNFPGRTRPTRQTMSATR